jgi:hypothetical protein
MLWRDVDNMHDTSKTGGEMAAMSCHGKDDTQRALGIPMDTGGTDDPPDSGGTRLNLGRGLLHSQYYILGPIQAPDLPSAGSGRQSRNDDMYAEVHPQL